MSTNTPNTGNASRFFVTLLAVLLGGLILLFINANWPGVFKALRISSFMPEPPQSMANKYLVVNTTGRYHLLRNADGFQRHVDAPVTTGSPVPQVNQWYYVTPSQDGTWYFMPAN